MSTDRDWGGGGVPASRRKEDGDVEEDVMVGRARDRRQKGGRL